MNYYEVLQVLPTALPEVIHMAYKALAKKYHPDVYTGDKKYAEEKMKLITAAYRVLSDPQLRQQYDKTYFNQGQSTQNQSSAESGKSSSSHGSTASQSPTAHIEKTLRLFTLMFKSFIEHNKYALSHLDELKKNIDKDSTVQYVLSELEKNYSDFESDFLLPGAMLIAIDKYKLYSTLNEHRELCECYSSYMNYIYAVSFPLDYYDSDYKKPLDKKYYSFYYDAFPATDGFQGRLIVRDVDAYKAAYESYQSAIKNFLGDETEEEKKRREEERRAEEKKASRPLRYVECWCDPFSFYPSDFADRYEIINIKSEPLKVSERYVFFARRLLLEKNIAFLIACHCIKKANEKDKSFCEREKALIDFMCERCSATDLFGDAWKELREALPGVTYVNKRYIEFNAKRICDNLDKMKNSAIKHMKSSQRQVSYDDVKKIEGRKSDIDRQLDYMERLLGIKSGFIHEELSGELSRQRSAVDAKFNETVSYLRNRITDYNAEKFWIPGKRCRHCGGDFKGVVKKTCVRCGKEKDYK